MKRVPYGTIVTLGLMLVLSTIIPAQSGMMGQRHMGQSEGAAEASPGGMMGMMGQGGMGMMGPQMMQQMMRGMMSGGMEGQPQSPMQMAGSPQNLTQEDKQGAVTASATLLTPDKPRPDGKLAVQVKLDTHAVDLDQYQLETLALLRDAQGREIQAVGLESLSGSGHHREGVLTFPRIDASGKPLLSSEAKSLTLILRLAGHLRGPARAQARHRRAIRLCTTPTVRRLRSHHAGLPVPMADPAHAGHVSYSGRDVRPVGPTGRVRGDERIWARR